MGFAGWCTAELGEGARIANPLSGGAWVAGVAMGESELEED